MNSSYTSSTTSSILASFLSILLMNKIGFSPCSSDLLRTKRVCGIGPSLESTSRITVSTVFMIRSTSDEKSAWPGVSTMFILTSLCITEQFLEYIVIPLSRSISSLSMTQSAIASLSLNIPLCFKKASTSVDLPASTWAITAMLIIFCLSDIILPSLFIDLTINYTTKCSLFQICNVPVYRFFTILF